MFAEYDVGLSSVVRHSLQLVSLRLHIMTGPVIIVQFGACCIAQHQKVEQY